ncbi:hypothetical protein ACWZUH_000058 [Campylobacter fetus]|uniref:Uncharacterized protein n=1 Tax=Campylobacter fetus TaxID=196 RepID=A0A825BBF6_CAMFE|nr:hypothetical protein [Campylobacter fetus]
MRIYIILIILMLISFGLYQRSVINELKGENKLLTEQRDEAIKTNKTLVSTINEIEKDRDRKLVILDEMVKSKDRSKDSIKKIMKEVENENSNIDISIRTARIILNRMHEQTYDNNKSRD